MIASPQCTGAALMHLKAAGKAQSIDEQAAIRNIPRFMVADALETLADKGLVVMIVEGGVPRYVVASAAPVAQPKPSPKSKAKARRTSRLT